MNAEALKIILNLQKENILLRSAIINAYIMLYKCKKHFVLRYDDNDAKTLLDAVYRILSFVKEEQQPSNKSYDSNNSIK